MALAGLVGCISPTSYGPENWMGGYKETRIGPDEYTVTFTANALLRWDECKANLLYRCAELTVGNGFDHFVIVESVDQSSIAPVGVRPAISATIIMGQGPKPARHRSAYDAAELLATLGPQLRRR